MIFNRPIWGPNVIMVNLPNDEINEFLPQIMNHIGLHHQIIGINAISDELEISERKIIIHQEDYEIYRELPSETKNPSTLMLDNKAKIVYYVDADVISCKAAFSHIYDLIEDEYPIICLSTDLIDHVQPAISIVSNFSDYISNNPGCKHCVSLKQFLSKAIDYSNKQFHISHTIA